VNIMASRPQRTNGLYQRLAADVGALGLPSGPARPERVTVDHLDGLPGAAQWYLRFMGVLGRPADWSFLAHSTGRFRMRPRWPWMRCEAWQYNSGPRVVRLFHMRADAAGLLPVIGRDAYVDGHGRMVGKLAGRVTVADGAGPESDVSELVTYLNDAVFWAPSMLLAPAVRWGVVDQASFDVSLEDAGHRVTARVFIDERGAPVNFSTEDRWCDLRGGPVRTRWSTPVGGWVEANGRRQPTSGAAIWHLPGGPFTYAAFQFAPGAVRYNVAPADLNTSEPPGSPAEVSSSRPWRRLAWPGRSRPRRALPSATARSSRSSM
jgi:hypothetical protein